MSSNLTRQTIADFGNQWTQFRDSPGVYGTTETLADIFGPLAKLSDVEGARVADIGSGTGRIVDMLLDAGAAQVVAVEPSAAMDVMRVNTAARKDRIVYVQGPGETLSRDLNLDLAVSIGVLHHIPNPAPVVAAMRDALRPGGRILVWLYGLEGNRLYLSIAKPLRMLTTHLPDPALWGLSGFLTHILNVYIAACKVLPLPMHKYMRGVLAKWTHDVRKLTIFDQLNPAYAKYYSKAEAIDLLAKAGFIDVEIYRRHGYSWTVSGRKAA